MAVLTALAFARPAAAQGVAPDTVSRPAAAAGSWTEQPRFVMLRSLLIPGWGQVHNRAWLKAAGVAGTETWLISSILRDQRDLDGLLSEVESARLAQDEARYAAAANRYNARLDTYVGRQWLLGGLLAYALVDAYVDAHFRNFDLEFKHDPALPEPLPSGTPAPDGGGTARGGRSSLALRWHF